MNCPGRKDTVFLVIALLAALLIPSLALAQQIPGQDSANAAMEFLRAMALEDFDKADGLCLEKTRKAFGPEGSRGLWKLVLENQGMPLSRQPDGSLRIIDWSLFPGNSEKCLTIIQATMEKGETSMSVFTIVEKGSPRVSAFFFGLIPDNSQEEAPAPAYARTEDFREIDMFVGRDGDLPATLAIPSKGTGPWPGIVLVHGSGPHDRDENVYGNKPFRDLAQGLASMGIAVLRYEKRTYARKAQAYLASRNMTLDYETSNDAADALVRLSENGNVDSQRVYLLGHSLGGYAAPRILSIARERGFRSAGVILMAAAALPLETAILRQYSYIFDLAGRTPEHQAHISGLMKSLLLIRGDSDRLAAAPATVLPLSIPASFWLDLRNYSPANELARLNVPVLLLAGEKDYQVTYKDLDTWVAALKWNQKPRVLVVPDAGHTFVPTGPGIGSPADYGVKGNVDYRVIREIGSFVLGM